MKRFPPFIFLKSIKICVVNDQFNIHALLQQIGEEWNDSTQSKEQIEAKLQHKQEAAMRRERALAYAFSHQVSDYPLSDNF